MTQIQYNKPTQYHRRLCSNKLKGQPNHERFESWQRKRLSEYVF
jgi:hypothetical protein